jgi:hypothetical protein
MKAVEPPPGASPLTVDVPAANSGNAVLNSSFAVLSADNAVAFLASSFSSFQALYAATHLS